jgi:hypothetical protein
MFVPMVASGGRSCCLQLIVATTVEACGCSCCLQLVVALMVVAAEDRSRWLQLTVATDG